MDQYSACDSGFVIFGMGHILPFHFFTNVCFEILVFTTCARGDEMYSAICLIKNVRMLLNPAEQSL